MDIRRIKQAQVPVRARLDAALSRQAEPLRRLGGELMHRLRQRQDAALHVPLQQAGERAVDPGVGQSGGVGGVGDHAGEGGSEDIRDILLVGDEVDHGHRAALRRQEVEEGVIGVLPLRLRDLRDRPALEGQMLRLAEGSRPDVLEAHQRGDVLEIPAALHPTAHLLAGGGVPKGGGELFDAARLKFRRQDVDQLGGPGGIGVGITGNVQTLRSGLGDERQHFRDRPAPVPAADGFQMADLHRRLQRPGRLQHLP